jgi:predicted RNA polymerase sigma factor
MTATPTADVIEAVWRIETPRLLGGLVRFVRDVLLKLNRQAEARVELERAATLATNARERALLLARAAALGA